MGKIQVLVCDMCGGTGQAYGDECVMCDSKGESKYEELSHDEWKAMLDGEHIRWTEWNDGLATNYRVGEDLYTAYKRRTTLVYRRYVDFFA